MYDQKAEKRERKRERGRNLEKVADAGGEILLSLRVGK